MEKKKKGNDTIFLHLSFLEPMIPFCFANTQYTLAGALTDDKKPVSARTVFFSGLD